jgi:hypothetical protein
MKLLSLGPVLCAALFCIAAFCQTPLPLQNVVKVRSPDSVNAKAGGNLQCGTLGSRGRRLPCQQQQAFGPLLHSLAIDVESWDAEERRGHFSETQTRNLGFSTMPVSVFTGDFEIVTRFKTDPGAASGSNAITGKLHYQACNQTTCLTPKTIEVTLPVEIVK